MPKFSETPEGLTFASKATVVDTTQAAGQKNRQVPVSQLLASVFPSEVEAAGDPVSGAVAIDLAQTRYHRFVLDGNTTFTVADLGTYWNTTSRGEFIVQFSITAGVEVQFGPEFYPTEDSEKVDTSSKIYVAKCCILNTGAVIYTLKGHNIVPDASFTNTLMATADLGLSTASGFTASMNFLATAEPDVDGLLYAGDVNYTVGSAATLTANTAPLEDYNTGGKLWAVPGNHDLDTSELNFTLNSTEDDFGGTWRYSNADEFSTDWKTNAATSAGWSTVGGEPGKIPGFGESDSTTVPVVSDGGATYYFAKVVNLAAAPGPGQCVRLSMYIDDGAAVYVNGVCVYNFNLKYPLSDSSLAQYNVASSASGVCSWTERTPHDILVPGSLFVSGNNLICAMVKQSSLTSTDLSWDCRIQYGVTTDLMPGAGDDFPFITGQGRPLFNYLTESGNGKCYRKVIPGVCDIFMLNDGFKTVGMSGGQTNPLTPEKDGAMHEWFKQAILASTEPFHIVVVHRTAVTTYDSSNYFYEGLDWDEFKDKKILIVQGHTHQNTHIRHSSGANIINVSNSGGQDSRAMTTSLIGKTGGWALQWADVVNPAVVRIRLNATHYRVEFIDPVSEDVLYQFTHTNIA